MALLEGIRLLRYLKSTSSHVWEDQLLYSNQLPAVLNESIYFAVFRILQEEGKTTGACEKPIFQLFLPSPVGFKYIFLD